MTRPLRLLLSTSNSTAAPPPQPLPSESDFVVVLAALLCAIICAVGLVAVARCAWLRRTTDGNNGGSATGQRLRNRGLKKKVLQSLSKYTYDSSSASGVGKDGGGGGGESLSATECAICLAEYVDGDEIRKLPQCGHDFHLNCIDTWLASHSSCPSCRQILVVARCHKCGEFPAATPAEAHAKARQDRTAASAPSSSTFLP